MRQDVIQQNLRNTCSPSYKIRYLSDFQSGIRYESDDCWYMHEVHKTLPLPIISLPTNGMRYISDSRYI